MRHILLIVILGIIITLVACDQSQQTFLSGKFEDYEGETYYLIPQKEYFGTNFLTDTTIKLLY
jgi:hypothetical protein